MTSHVSRLAENNNSLSSRMVAGGLRDPLKGSLGKAASRTKCYGAIIKVDLYSMSVERDMLLYQ